VNEIAMAVSPLDSNFRIREFEKKNDQSAVNQSASSSS
jgi:hypothetical protein